MPDDLSPRMWEIVTLVIEERMTYDEVAERLEISARTVKSYVREIARRAGGGSPQKAIALFYRSRQDEAA